MSNKRTLLVADVATGQATLRNVMGDRTGLVGAATLEEAREALGRGVDMVVCGIHFDDSRMFDLLRYARADPRFRPVPFICFRDLESELAPALFESLDIACTALGAAAFVDLFTLKKRHGIADADAAFRRILLDRLERPESDVTTSGPCGTVTSVREPPGCRSAPCGTGTLG